MVVGVMRQQRVVIQGIPHGPWCDSFVSRGALALGLDPAVRAARIWILRMRTTSTGLGPLSSPRGALPLEPPAPLTIIYQG